MDMFFACKVMKYPSPPKKKKKKKQKKKRQYCLGFIGVTCIETPWVVQEEQRLPIMHLIHGEHGPRPRHQEAHRW